MCVTEEEQESEVLQSQHGSHSKRLKGTIGQIGDGAELRRIIKKKHKDILHKKIIRHGDDAPASWDICYSRNLPQKKKKPLLSSFSAA